MDGSSTDQILSGPSRALLILQAAYKQIVLRGFGWVFWLFFVLKTFFQELLLLLSLTLLSV